MSGEEPSTWKVLNRYVLSALRSRSIQGLAALLAISAFLTIALPQFFQNVGTSALVLVGLILLVLIVAIARHALLQNRRRRDFIQREYDGAVRTASFIARRIFDVETPQWRIAYSEEEITVEEDGTCDVRREFQLVAGEDGAQVWKFAFQADQSAEPIKFIGDLGFEVHCESDEIDKVCYLTTRNDNFSKEVCIYFPPGILAGDTRRLKVIYRWPGFAGDLIAKGHTQFTLDYRSFSPSETCKVNAIFRFKRKIGTVTFQTETPNVGQIVPYVGDDYSEFVFKNDAFPLSVLRVSFAAERRVDTR